MLQSEEGLPDVNRKLHPIPFDHHHTEQHPNASCLLNVGSNLTIEGYVLRRWMRNGWKFELSEKFLMSTPLYCADHEGRNAVSGFPPRDRQHPASGIWFIVVVPEKMPGLHAINVEIPGTDQAFERRFLTSPFQSRGRAGMLITVARFTSNTHQPTVYAFANAKDPISYLRIFDAISVTVMSNTRMLPQPTKNVVILPEDFLKKNQTEFPLGGYNLAQICESNGSQSNPDKLFTVMSSRLAWLCEEWFGSSAGVLEMLYQSGALISGSAALKLISGSSFTPGDIDFVVASAQSDVVHRFLVDKGYQLDASFGTSYANRGYDTSGIQGFVLRRYRDDNRGVDVSIAPVRCGSCHHLQPRGCLTSFVSHTFHHST